MKNRVVEVIGGEDWGVGCCLVHVKDLWCSGPATRLGYRVGSGWCEPGLEQSPVREARAKDVEAAEVVRAASERVVAGLRAERAPLS